MKTSKLLVKEAGLHPKLRLMRKETNERGHEITVPTGQHKVRLVADKLLPPKKDPNTGKMIEYVRYLVEKDGNTYTYDTKRFNKDTGELSYLVQRLAEIEENTYVILEAKKIGTQNYIAVKQIDKISDDKDIEVDDNEEEYEEAE